MDEVLTFHKDYETGAVTVDRFVDQCLFTAELLEAADPAMLWKEGRIITVKVANGEARYRVEEVAMEYASLVFRAMRVGPEATT